MKFKAAGKFQWNGIFLGDGDVEDQCSFAVFADDIEQAIKSANETLPDGAVVVALSREKEPIEIDFDLPDDHPTVVAMKEARDRSLN